MLIEAYTRWVVLKCKFPLYKVFSDLYNHYLEKVTGGVIQAGTSVKRVSQKVTQKFQSELLMCDVWDAETVQRRTEGIRKATNYQLGKIVSEIVFLYAAQACEQKNNPQSLIDINTHIKDSEIASLLCKKAAKAFAAYPILFNKLVAPEKQMNNLNLALKMLEEVIRDSIMECLPLGDMLHLKYHVIADATEATTTPTPDIAQPEEPQPRDDNTLSELKIMKKRYEEATEELKRLRAKVDAVPDPVSDSREKTRHHKSPISSPAANAVSPISPLAAPEAASGELDIFDMDDAEKPDREPNSE